jgi:aromatic ring-opening dioxygenase catalytic subunit (LigB family)
MNAIEEIFTTIEDFEKQSKAFQLAIPTPEHYVPLIYTLGLKGKPKNSVCLMISY